MPHLLHHVALWLHANRLLAILLFAYMLVSMLVFEQGRTIENQRALIQQLYADSIQLNAVRMREVRAHRQ